MTAKQGQVLRSMPLAYTVAIFSESDIELPVQIVLNPPMLTQPLAIELGADFPAANEITHFRGRLALHGPLAGTHTDGRQLGPVLRLTDPLRRVQHGIATVFFTAVTTFALVPSVVLQPRKVGVECLSEPELDVCQQMRLVVLDGQGVV